MFAKLSALALFVVYASALLIEAPEEAKSLHNVTLHFYLSAGDPTQVGLRLRGEDTLSYIVNDNVTVAPEVLVKIPWLFSSEEYRFIAYNMRCVFLRFYRSLWLSSNARSLTIALLVAVLTATLLKNMLRATRSLLLVPRSRMTSGIVPRERFSMCTMFQRIVVTSVFCLLNYEPYSKKHGSLVAHQSGMYHAPS
ncbi:hypothetical protein OG21DRAFT_513446 [Imleria badia]|nr:hypothetical protein OG21DRAFT_513446 [Imleria badia]